MKRILTMYIIREISSLFILGIGVFTLILLMGRLIKLTEMVITQGIPLFQVALMIFYLMPSFLVFTIPMAFLLAVLLALGRLSSDNEITVMKSCGISVMQLMPPVLACGFAAALLTLAAGTAGVPWGNSAFKRLTFELLKENVSMNIHEKVFWDKIPGIIIYTDRYDNAKRLMGGVIIHDGRDKGRQMTIFASEGIIRGGEKREEVHMALKNGSIHSPGKAGEYRQVKFEDYTMTITNPGSGKGLGRSEIDMGIGELRRLASNSATPAASALKAAAEMQSRFALPVASLVFAVLAVPLGMQNRRSGKSGGFAVSIFVLLSYYILFSFLRTLAEKGTIPAGLALWIPNLIFLLAGWYLLEMTSRERSVRDYFSTLFSKVIPRKGDA